MVIHFCGLVCRYCCALGWILAIAVSAAKGQSVAYGFKAGGGLGNFVGPRELADDGSALENFRGAFKLHAGLVAALPLGSRWGVQAELLYQQKGTRYKYEGPSYRWPLFDVQGLNVRRRISYVVSNNYVELPLLVYARAGKFRIGAGASAGVMLTSKVLGNYRYFDDDPDLEGKAIEFDVDASLFRDSPTNTNVGAATQEILGDNYPTTVNLYFFEPQNRREQAFMNRLDLNALLDLAYTPNNGRLYVGARAAYGLLDVTNNYYDYSKYRLNADGSLMDRNDLDRNLLLQFYVQFSVSQAKD